jgi:hypothetical protein
MQPHRSSKSVYAAIVFVLLLWAGLAAVYFGRNAIFDWWRLQGYTPPAAIVALADDTTMSDDSRRLFYVYRPSIDESDSFNTHCRDSEFTIVLGCYISYQGIYIFNIDDERLAGVQQVTAAHELLHAEYDRLSSGERARVDKMLADFYAGLRDTRITETVAQYEQKDPGSVPNELHSIIGTEVRDLPDNIEQYYAQYFTDRRKIVAYSENYESAFSSRKSQIDDIEKQLTTLKTQIEYANRELESRQDYITNTGASLKQRAANGSASQSEIDAYNQDVDDFNAKINTTNRLVSTYNSKREEYLKLVGEQNDLFKEIDSRQSIDTQ